METAIIGTPLIDPYGNHGFIADVKESNGRQFIIGAGMGTVRSEYVCVFAKRISELADGIAAPFIERAKRANLPHVDASEIPARMEAARQAEREAREAMQRGREEAARKRAAFEADAAKRIPPWANAAIVAELIEDRSDSMTDYFGSTIRRTVILAFSRHTRDLFSEMRKAARNFADTAHLADAPETAEHREKYSMGGGYYLKDGYRHSNGWQVSKITLRGDNPAHSLPICEWSLAPKAESTTEASAVGGVRIEEHTHTKKGFQMWVAVLPDRVDRDTFDTLRDRAKDFGGWYSRPWGKTPGGFAFKAQDKAEAFAATLESTEPVSADVQATPSRPDVAEKLRTMADKLQADIDGKFADRRTNTPKQQRQAAQARQDGRHLQRAQSAMRALADAHDAGNVPPELRGVTTKSAIVDLMRSRIDRSNAGYYDVGIDTGEPATDSDAARALWAMIKGPSKEDREAEELRQKIDGLKFANIPGYFPTPLAVVERMIWAADMPAGEFDCLEPEGGSGAILDVIRSRFPRATLTTFERHNSLRDVLTRKGYALAGDDFMEAPKVRRFDRVLMNPPFEHGQDIDHVRHAHAMLREGGRLVAIMSAGPFFRQDRKSAEFRDWFDDMGGERVDLPAGSFKESGTGVASVLVTIDAEG